MSGAIRRWWRPHVETVRQLTRARPKRQRRAFHDYVRDLVLGHFITDRIDAAANALADPPIASCAAQMFVARHNLLRRPSSLWVPCRDPGADSAASDRGGHALLQAEGQAVKGARHVEDAVAIPPNSGRGMRSVPAFGHEPAVEPGVWRQLVGCVIGRVTGAQFSSHFGVPDPPSRVPPGPILAEDWRGTIVSICSITNSVPRA